MEWWDTMTFPLGRVWSGMAKRLRLRKSGQLRLRHDVRDCEYEDVHVMWEMLKRNKTKSSAERSKNLNFFDWARRTPYLCRSF